MKNGLRRGDCLLFFFRARAAIRGRQAYYERTYGLLPTFKAGLHCGPVIVTEVGEIKSNIVFHGDTLNTVSRIQSLCNELQCDLLLSEELAQRLETPSQIRLTQAGEFHLRGRERKIAIFRAEATRSENAPTMRR